MPQVIPKLAVVVRYTQEGRAVVLFPEIPCKRPGDCPGSDLTLTEPEPVSMVGVLKETTPATDSQLEAVRPELEKVAKAQGVTLEVLAVVPVNLVGRRIRERAWIYPTSPEGFVAAINRRK